MINHSNCDRPSTSGARAKCRRAQATGDAAPIRKVMTKVPRDQRDDDDDRYGQTPRDKDKECVKRGVEKIIAKGTDPLTGILLYVGEKCYYYIKQSDDREYIEV